MRPSSLLFGYSAPLLSNPAPGRDPQQSPRPRKRASSAHGAQQQQQQHHAHAQNYLNPRQRFRRKGHGRDLHYQQAAVLEVGAMVLQNMFSALSFLHYRKDDDFVDRLSYFYTSSFLIMMAVLVSFKQFGGRPLECWVPAQFTASWEAYTEMYCWAQNTYWVPIDQDIPVDIAEREYRQISYYQWVPFFLLIEAFLYYIPCLMWRLMSDKSGIRMNDIVQLATEKENIEPDYRIRTIESLSRHIESALRYQHTATSRTQYTLHRVFKCFNMRYYESYVTGLYLMTKLMYVGNILTNLILVNKFLETDEYSVYGFGVLRDLLFGRSWMESGNFPRVTLCDFEVRVLGNNQRHSVQCVLVINIFNEKIFILVWLWFTVLLVAATLDALYWFSISLFHRDRFRFVLRHLELTSDPDKPELFRKEKRKQVEHFLKTYLKDDRPPCWSDVLHRGDGRPLETLPLAASREPHRRGFVAHQLRQVIPPSSLQDPRLDPIENIGDLTIILVVAEPSPSGGNGTAAGAEATEKAAVAAASPPTTAVSPVFYPAATLALTARSTILVGINERVFRGGYVVMDE
uniref:Innexin n=1 Tax=Steinernema glaseri TaxID=37863 RepID=A0A1I7Y076_9BILA